MNFIPSKIFSWGNARESFEEGHKVCKEAAPKDKYIRMGTMVEVVQTPEVNAFLVNIAKGTPFAISPFPASTWVNIADSGFNNWAYVNWHTNEPRLI